MAERAQLSDKRVLLVGAGGLGTPVALILARSGVGFIEVADDDVVDLSNLHRQLLYTEADVGRAKASAACARIEREARDAGQTCMAVAREMRVLPDSARAAVRGFDLVVEGADNFASKFLIADACALEGVPCVQAGAVRWTGWALATLPGRSACLRCVFEDIPPGPAHGCAEAGVVGPVVGVVGAIQAALALRILHGDASVAGVLHHYRALEAKLRHQPVQPRAACALCRGTISDLNENRYAPRECAA
jgi:molybdopterin-synthase adenylyltransferase